MHIFGDKDTQKTLFLLPFDLKKCNPDDACLPMEDEAQQDLRRAWDG